jgi:3-oxoacyl-[acyl-carrier protein] reductase
MLNPTTVVASFKRDSILEVIPLGRLAETQDIAMLALFLASEASSYITGQCITIDGGAVAWGPAI